MERKMSLEPDYNEIRYRIKKKYDNRVEFISHVVAFLGANFVLWAVLQPQNGWATLSSIAMGGWFIGVLCHTVVFWGKEAQESAIQREIEREREFRGQYTSDTDMKRKREHLQLTEDGELLDIVDEDSKAAKRR
jgi:hypothetical protein